MNQEPCREYSRKDRVDRTEYPHNGGSEYTHYQLKPIERVLPEENDDIFSYQCDESKGVKGG